MKLWVVLLLFAGLVAAQSPVPALLPSHLVGTGVAWNRYSAHPLSEITSVAIRVAQSNVYSWSTLDTPIAKAPAGDTAQPSSVRTGAGYVLARSASGSAFLVLLGDVGLATTPSTVSSGYSAGMGVPIRIRRSCWYVMPLYRIVGAGSTAMKAAPEFQVWYSFGN
jgi:hypothetical protein